MTFRAFPLPLPRRPARPVALAFLAVFALFACHPFGGSASTSPAPAARTTTAQQTDGDSILLGVWQPGAPWDMSALNAFEQEAGKHVAIVHWYESWYDSQNGPDLSLLQAVDAHGSVPMISWAPDGHQGSAQTVYSLADIAAGKFDTYAQLWAGQLASFGKPVLLRFAWEMNGDWFPWGTSANTPDEYVAAWRHLHDIFVAAGATNVQWVWSPNIVGGYITQLESYYPGDDDVDWLALDGYNRAEKGWKSFTDLFGESYDRLTALSDKPVMIAETSSSEADAGTPSGESKADWISSALTDEIPGNFPRIRALVWFNEDKSGVEADGSNWRIDSSGDARSAFSAAVDSSLYQANW